MEIAALQGESVTKHEMGLQCLQLLRQRVTAVMA
jgi:hypothetical protein